MILLLCGLSLLFQTQEAEPNWRDRVSCGVNCAYYLLVAEGVQVDYSHIQSSLIDSKKGASIQGIVQFLREKGLDVVAQKIGPSQLRQVQLPLIAHVGNKEFGHYVVVLSVSEKHVVIFDSSASVSGLMEVPFHEFSSNWSGNAVILNSQGPGWLFYAFVFSVACAVIAFANSALRRRSSVSNITIAYLVFSISGCSQSNEADSNVLSLDSHRKLSINKTEEQLGIILAKETKTCRFEIKNLASEKITLTLGHPSCQCAAARLLKKELPSGDSTEVEIDVTNKGLSGGRVDASVVLSTSLGEMYQLTARGFHEGVSFSPTSNLVANEVKKQYSLKGKLYLRQPAEEKVDVSLDISETFGIMAIDQVSVDSQLEGLQEFDLTVHLSVANGKITYSNDGLAFESVGITVKTNDLSNYHKVSLVFTK